MRWVFDGALAAGIVCLALMERGTTGAVVLACGFVMAAALLARRALAVPVAFVVYGLAAAHLAVQPMVRLFDVAVLVSMYSVVKYGPGGRWPILAGAFAGLGVLLGAWAEDRRAGNFWTVVWVVGAVTVAVWVTAHGVRTRRLYVASLEERNATLQRERDHLTRLATADERAAIARELHDVVAHSLSVMIVQADGATYTLDPSATQARTALATIAATGREALDDMRRVVSLLRAASPPPLPSASSASSASPLSAAVRVAESGAEPAAGPGTQPGVGAAVGFGAG
ncbi:histidine kinase, partial [Dactylosporangium sp. NPDC005572]|uniref:sensor histidine kinase n=1 Tax=Dactylosporangium sp. NPDC005572 TaxID=3156889 RepID=UPI0033A51B9A